MSIHNYNQKYLSTIEGIKNSDLSEKNKEILLEFSESLVLEGLSKPRMIRCLFTMQNLAKKLECDLDKAQKKHLKGIVSALQIGNYSPWTKRTYKCI